MESTTQPILCCIGSTVAGRPTQFLMERAINAQRLDWRALTVEVPEQKFAVAVDGMTAMNFKALRIFPSLGAAALEKFGQDDPQAQFVGSLTSAAWTGGRWETWDNAGFAVLQSLNSRLDWTQCVCWLDGNGVRNRSLLVALRTRGIRPAKLIWTRAPGEIPDELLRRENTASTPELQRPAEGELTQEFLKECFPSDAPARSLVLSVEEFAEVPEALRDWLQSGNPGLNVYLVSQKGAEGKLPQRFTRITEEELTIAGEVYDFQRWTGNRVDMGLLRDAFDEFSDF